MTDYYLIATSDRSANAIQDGSAEITIYYLTLGDPLDDDKFDRWINTSERHITTLQADSDEQARELFSAYMSENYDLSNQFDINDFGDGEGDIACLSVGPPSVDNDFYTCKDPLGVTESGDSCPQPKEGVEILCGFDGGGRIYIDDNPWFNDFLDIPELQDFLKTLDDSDPEDEFDDEGFDIDWRSIDLDSEALKKIIEILGKNGYSTDIAESPGHLDVGSPNGCGEGSIFTYVFIKRDSMDEELTINGLAGTDDEEGGLSPS